MTTEFERDIKNPTSSVIMDLSYQGKPLLIAFGGIVGGLGIPPFEFFNLTKDLDVNKIYIRDLNQTWYHSGLPGISNNIDETASFLRKKIDESGANKVVVFGNSMGGYAAIVFGILIKADVVHAFSPQTSLKDTDIIRSKKKIRYVHDNFSDKYFDLIATIKSHDDSGEFNIYYDTKNRIDNQHAKHFTDLENVKQHSFLGGGHGLIKLLRNSGDLKKIIISSLNGTPIHAIDTDSTQYRSFLARIFSID